MEKHYQRQWRHLVGAPFEGDIDGGSGVARGGSVLEGGPQVGSDDGNLSEVLEEACAVVRPLARNDQRQLSALPLAVVGQLLHLVHVGLISAAASKEHTHSEQLPEFRSRRAQHSKVKGD